jgi:hypothetical protein
MSKRMIVSLLAYLAAIALAGAMLSVIIRQSLLAITPVPIDIKSVGPTKEASEWRQILRGMVWELPDPKSPDFTERLRKQLVNMNNFKILLVDDEKMLKNSIDLSAYALYVFTDKAINLDGFDLSKRQQILDLLGTIRVQPLRLVTEGLKYESSKLIEDIDRYNQNLDAARNLDEGLARFEKASGGKSTSHSLVVKSGRIAIKNAGAARKRSDFLRSMVPELPEPGPPDHSVPDFDKKLLDMHIFTMKESVDWLETDNQTTKRSIDLQIAILSRLTHQDLNSKIVDLSKKQQILDLLGTLRVQRLDQAAEEINNSISTLMEDIGRYNENLDALRALDEGVARFEKARQTR